MRVAIGGIYTECCTFSPLLIRGDEFRVLRAENMLPRYEGFLSKFDDVTFTPIIFARAIPGGRVERDFYEATKAEFLDALRAGAPWDGLHLDLHGALNVDGMDDAEGDWIASARQVVGADCVIVASYDLHGNVSQRVFDNLDLLTAFRTAPHIDARETLERAYTLLVDCLRRGERPHKAYIPVPVLLPGERTSTEWEPGQTLYGRIPGVVARDGILDASILVGYAWADEPRTTASVVVYGSDQDAVNGAASELASAYWNVRAAFDFGVPALQVDDCIERALAAEATPVFISDSGDNPTAGGVGDVTYVLERLIAYNVTDVVYASIADAAAVDICHRAGEGARVSLSLGGKLDNVNGKPLEVEGEVLCLATFPARSGDDNRQAVIRIGAPDSVGIVVIITERRTPFHHEHEFQRLGIEPTAHRIVVVKIGYLEPDLKRMARTALLALSPGAVDQDLVRLPYKRVPRPSFPLDPEMNWAPPDW